jgi:hypothetical protein
VEDFLERKVQKLLQGRLRLRKLLLQRVRHRVERARLEGKHLFLFVREENNSTKKKKNKNKKKQKKFFLLISIPWSNIKGMSFGSKHILVPGKRIRVEKNEIQIFERFSEEK